MCVFLSFKYKPCHTPLMYMCLIKKCDHIRENFILTPHVSFKRQSFMISFFMNSNCSCYMLMREREPLIHKTWKLLFLVDWTPKLALKTHNHSSPSHLRWICHKPMGGEVFGNVRWMRGILVTSRRIYRMIIRSLLWFDGGWVKCKAFTAGARWELIKEEKAHTHTKNEWRHRLRV